MRIPSFEKTRMLTPTAGERLTSRPAVVILLFLLVLFASQLIRSLLEIGGATLLSDNLDRDGRMLLALTATLATSGTVLLYCLIMERRSLMSLGFVRREAFLEYSTGLLGGLAMFGMGILICVATGTITLTPSVPLPSWGLLLLFLGGFLIQGMSEELLCRSYLMVSLSRCCPLWLCAVINALVFSLLHLANPGISVIAILNIFLFGLFASILTLRRGSIWMAAGLHSMWNFAQGNLFGIPVSGMGEIASPLHAHMAEGGWQTLINGGVFGLEGGLAVTVVLAIACGGIALMPTKKSETGNKCKEQIT